MTDPIPAIVKTNGRPLVEPKTAMRLNESSLIPGDRETIAAWKIAFFGAMGLVLAELLVGLLGLLLGGLLRLLLLGRRLAPLLLRPGIRQFRGIKSCGDFVILYHALNLVFVWPKVISTWL